MEINELRYFLAVADHSNFTRAAESLGISQPALSRAIARLEEDLGQPVFERKTRAIALTDAGELLLIRARQIVSLLNDTRAEITDDGETGRIRIAAIPTIAPFFLPGLLQSFGNRNPKASLIVQEDVTEQTLKRCHDGDVDLAILALPVTTQYLEIETLFDEELLLVLPPDHPLQNKKAIRMSDVEPLPFVLLGEAHCLSDNILSFCRQKSFLPLAVERTSQLATVQELVSLGHGVSMVPAMAKAVDASTRRVYRSLSGQKPMRTIVMVWNAYRFQSKLFGKFKQHVRDYSQTYAETISSSQ